MKSINLPYFILLISFNSAIRQALTQPNIPTIRYITCLIIVNNYVIFLINYQQADFGVISELLMRKVSIKMFTFYGFIHRI